MTERAAWDSIHVFMSQPEKFLIEAVAPELERRVQRRELDSWFFVRYWEGGAHLRVRLKNASRCVFAEVRSIIAGRVTDYIAAADAAKVVVAIDVVGPGSTVGEAPGSVLDVPYVPEEQRYGGDLALGVNEDLFCKSTTLALRVIGATGEGSEGRVNQGVDLMLAGAASMCETLPVLCRFFRDYAQFWQREIERDSDATRDAPEVDAETRRAVVVLASRYLALRRAGAARRPGNLAEAWLDLLCRANARFLAIAARGALVSPSRGAIVGSHSEAASAVAAIMSSQIHMLNNRLGILPAAERRLATVVNAALC